MKPTLRMIPGATLAVLVLGGATGRPSTETSPVRVADVLCDGRRDPVGVEPGSVRFSWVMESEVRAQAQGARWIEVASSQETLVGGQADVWAPGRVGGSESLLVPYAGPPLEPARAYFWRVRVEDAAGRLSGWSAPSRFVTALSGPSDWGEARWIGYADMPGRERLVPGVHGLLDPTRHPKPKRPVVPLLRRVFTVRRPVAQALLFVSGLGHYEAYLNGEKVGDRFLAPGWTDYRRTVLYDAYDVTAQLQPGPNAIAAIVGHGFHHVAPERYYKLAIAYGWPRLLAALRVRYADGGEETIATGPAWKAAPSPITFTSLYGGEDYDARLEQTYLMGEAVHFDHDLFGLYRKQFADVIDAQTPSGLVPDEGHLLSHGLGDWYDLGPRFPGEAQLTPKAVTATATYFHDLRLLVRAASVLGKPEEAARYRALAGQVKRAFNEAFFDAKAATWSTGSQTALALPLVVGLAPDGEEERVAASLVRRIEEDGRALTAGDVGFHYVVEALSRAGRGDLLFAMNARDDVPGYGFQLKKGATALTESWAALEEVSNNHLMLGHLERWFYAGLLGIDQADDSTGYAALVLKPQVVDGIEWARGEYRSPRGRIASSWRKEPGRLVLEVEVPVNATAEVHVPAPAGARILESGRRLVGRPDVTPRPRAGNATVVAVGSGRYRFEVEW
jgi:hypothetical protein